MKQFLETLAIVTVVGISGFLFVPFSPFFPAAELDSSWPYAINEAVARRLVFGRDVIFTGGPLSAAYTAMFHPATDTAMLVCNVLFAGGLFGGCVALGRSRGVLPLLALPVFVARLGLRDTPLLVLPLVFLLFALSRCAGGTITSLWSRAGMMLGAAGVALLPLVKGSFAGTALLCTVLAVWALVSVSPRMAAVLPAWMLSVLTAAWMMMGQPVAALPDYIWSLVPIVTGYEAAMSSAGPAAEVLLFLGVGVCVVLTFAETARIVFQGFSQIALAGFIGVLFVGFKAGFTRHGGHAAIAGECLLLGAYFTLLLLRTRRAKVTMLVALAAWGVATYRWRVEHAPEIELVRIQGSVRSAVEGLSWRLAGGDVLRQRLANALSEIRRKFPLPEVKGTVDLYPTDLGLIFAHDLKWSPRPIIQSYSAYTPTLSALNRAHLVGPRAPDTILFSIAAIDERYPSLEDGESWLELMTRYQVTAFTGQYAVLEKRRLAAPPPGRALISEETAALGQSVETGGAAQVWAEIDVTPTWFGRVAGALVKLPPLRLAVKYDDGSTAPYRFVSGMGRSGFLLKPTVQNSLSFAALQSSGRRGQFGGRSLVSFQVRSKTWAEGILWRRQYRVRLTSLNPIADERLAEVLPMAVVGGLKDRPPIGGDCAIETINGETVESARLRRNDGRMFWLRGWAVISAIDGTENDRVFVRILGDESDKQMLARKFSRRDLGELAGRPELHATGFEAVVEGGLLRGGSQIVVEQEKGNRRFICGQASIELD